jgi:hypothetical protein
MSSPPSVTGGSENAREGRARRGRPDQLRKAPTGRGRRSGFTLLEVSLYAALLLILGTPLVSVMLASSRNTTDNDTMNRLTERNRNAIFQIEGDLRVRVSEYDYVSEWGTWVAVMPAMGFDGANVIPGSWILWYLRMTPGEWWDGTDNNGNGLVDEGEIVRLDYNDYSWTVVSSGIDINQTGFGINGDGILATVTNMGTMRGGGAPYRVSKSVTVFPRN